MKKFSSMPKDDLVNYLVRISHVLSESNQHIMARIFYDSIKMAYYRVKRKTERSKTHYTGEIILKEREVARILRTVHYLHVNNRVYTASHELIQCFGKFFKDEGPAVRFFEEFVEGKVQDKFGRTVIINLEEGLRFMYKDPNTQRHIVSPENYVPSRGKRLPWIKHTIAKTKNIYRRIDKKQEELLYINQYEIELKEQDNVRCYWLVVAKKNKKDKVGPYRFKTAWPIHQNKYNRLLKIIEGFDPAEI